MELNEKKAMVMKINKEPNPLNIIINRTNQYNQEKEKKCHKKKAATKEKEVTVGERS